MLPAVAGSVGINRLKEESTELLTDAQFFSEAGFHNPLASAKASKAGQTVRLKPGMHLAHLRPSSNATGMVLVGVFCHTHCDITTSRKACLPCLG